MEITSLDFRLKSLMLERRLQEAGFIWYQQDGKEFYWKREGSIEILYKRLYCTKPRAHKNGQDYQIRFKFDELRYQR
ncbi:MAG: hypothetical protein AABY07_06950 [Nanoarchaeota archaeon]